MHRVLLTPELVAIVCAMADQSTACAMARTCRAWHDAALDCVWKVLDTNYALDALFSLLPLEVYERSKNRCNVPGRWLAAPGEGQYELLYKYSRRVRVLDLLRCSVQDALRVLFDLPESQEHPLAVLMPTFASMALSEVTVDVGVRTSILPVAEVDLHAISIMGAPGRGPQLSIHWYTRMPILVGARQDIVRKIQIGALQNSSWSVLAALPCLESLDVSWDRWSHPITRMPSMDRPFQALRTLKMCAYEDCKPLVADMLRCCGRVSLSSLQLYTDCDEDDEEADPTNNWTLLFRAMRDHCVCSDLRVLEVHDSKETTRVQDTDLELLLPFHRLTTLSLHNHAGFSVHETTIATLMQKCTLLRTLELVTSDLDANLGVLITRHIPTCAPACLLEIARYGVSLESLAIIVDWEAGLPADWQQRQPLNMNPLELDFWNSGLGDAFNAADFILATFPAVDDLRVSQLDMYSHGVGSREYLMSDKWQEVRNQVWIAQKAMLRQAHNFEKSRLWKYRRGLGWNMGRNWDKSPVFEVQLG